jgi:long-chain acyl-CoA synthetase
MSTLDQLARRVLEREPSRLIFEHENRWISTGEVRELADRVNGLIAASGASPHAPVAFVPRNRPGALAALIGLIAAGKYIRMIHVYQSPAGIARDIVRLKPAVVVATSEDICGEFLSTLREQGIAAIALTDMDAAAVPGCERSSALCDPLPALPQIDLLTSGTTGPPKQFGLTYEFLAKDMVAGNVAASNGADPAEQPPWLLYWPFGNFSGLYGTLYPILLGIRAVLVDRFTLAGWHDFVLRYRPDWASLPPAGIQMVLEGNIPPADLACVRFVRTGAAPLDPTLQRAFEERYGIPVLLTYGATEFGGPIAAMSMELHPTWGRQKLGSVGRPIPGAQMRVVDEHTGVVLPAGTEGLFEVISPRMGPHWIRTTDLGLIDEDGFVFHRGRADGAIVRGGFKLLPEAIENALLLHDAVDAAGVVGIPDKRLGQVPAAAIRLNPRAARPTIAELKGHLRHHLEATHIPVAWRFVETLPYTAMLKADRAALRRLFETADETRSN